ncbi:MULTISPECIES: hypothetical protein [Pandoraea]|uniref:hypothetical protein n=1 Tax=Pandoraea TaxID=93217 RepID=UPI001F5C52F3|nr:MULTISPECIES: hypothetical protein [Pandoraea]MCI3208331.1 hypothetical protein [Pandoraea sp. LA3]MDN4586360.1 hypothetical protein [Pandoraea capi]
MMSTPVGRAPIPATPDLGTGIGETPLAAAMRRFEEVAGAASAGSEAMLIATAFLEMEVFKPHNWQHLAPCFKDDVNVPETAKLLVQCHLATSREGLLHVLGQHPKLDVADKAAARLLASLKPHVRDAMVANWRNVDATGLHAISAGLIAVQIPGTVFRCPLIGRTFTRDGLDLTQHEATSLLQSNFEGASSRTLLEAFADTTTHYFGMSAFLFGLAVGVEGSVMSGLDKNHACALARSLLTALAGDQNSVTLRVPLARFFGALGEYRIAAELHAQAAQIAERRDAETAVCLVMVPAAAREEQIGIQRGMQLRIGANQAWSGVYREKTGELCDSAMHMFKASYHLYLAGEAKAGAVRDAAQAQLLRLALSADVAKVYEVLVDAVRAFGPNYPGISALCKQCADVFEQRGLPADAAAIHKFAFEQLYQMGMRYDQDIDIEVLTAISADHQANARRLLGVTRNVL